MIKRRSFLKNALLSTCALSTSPLLALDNILFIKKNEKENKILKISLAQWSLHRHFNDGRLDPKDFASISTKTYGISALEYVNGFYTDSGDDEKFWKDMKRRADDVGAKSLLIMVDDEGDLGVANDSERKKSVENHYKWVNAAKLLGCHSVRVNAFGETDKNTFRSAIIDGLGQLSEYAAKENINIIIENHGLYSSDANLMAGVIEQVNKPNLGTIPDFGNWCLSAKWGSTQSKCDEVYDRYQGVSEFLPFAKAVSAKSYNFNSHGEDSIIDYYRLLKIVKESDYDGHIGIEYEGEELGEHEGILATKALIEKVWESLK